MYTSINLNCILRQILFIKIKNKPRVCLYFSQSKLLIISNIINFINV